MKLSFTEQLYFFGHFIDEYKEKHETHLNKSVRSISTIFVDKTKKVICSQPNYKKDYVTFVKQLAHVHTFMLDTIKDREGVFESKAQYDSIRSRLECLQKLETCHISEKALTMIEIVQNGCRQDSWSKVGDFFGQITNLYCREPQKAFLEKCEL